MITSFFGTKTRMIKQMQTKGLLVLHLGKWDAVHFGFPYLAFLFTLLLCMLDGTSTHSLRQPSLRSKYLLRIFKGRHIILHTDSSTGYKLKVYLMSCMNTIVRYITLSQKIAFQELQILKKESE